MKDVLVKVLILLGKMVVNDLSLNKNKNEINNVNEEEIKEDIKEKIENMVLWSYYVYIIKWKTAICWR